MKALYFEPIKKYQAVMLFTGLSMGLVGCTQNEMSDRGLESCQGEDCPPESVEMQPGTQLGPEGSNAERDRNDGTGGNGGEGGNTGDRGNTGERGNGGDTGGRRPSVGNPPPSLTPGTPRGGGSIGGEGTGGGNGGNTDTRSPNNRNPGGGGTPTGGGPAGNGGGLGGEGTGGDTGTRPNNQGNPGGGGTPAGRRPSGNGGGLGGEGTGGDTGTRPNNQGNPGGGGTGVGREGTNTPAGRGGGTPTGGTPTGGGGNPGGVGTGGDTGTRPNDQGNPGGGGRPTIGGEGTNTPDGRGGSTPTGGTPAGNGGAPGGVGTGGNPATRPNDQGSPGGGGGGTPTARRPGTNTPQPRTPGTWLPGDSIIGEYPPHPGELPTARNVGTPGEKTPPQHGAPRVKNPGTINPEKPGVGNPNAPRSADGRIPQVDNPGYIRPWVWVPKLTPTVGGESSNPIPRAGEDPTSHNTQVHNPLPPPKQTTRVTASKGESGGTKVQISSACQNPSNTKITLGGKKQKLASWSTRAYVKQVADPSGRLAAAAIDAIIIDDLLIQPKNPMLHVLKDGKVEFELTGFTFESAAPASGTMSAHFRPLGAATTAEQNTPALLAHYIITTSLVFAYPVGGKASKRIKRHVEYLGGGYLLDLTKQQACFALFEGSTVPLLVLP